VKPPSEASAWGQRFGLVAGVTDRSHGSLGLSVPEPAGVVMERFREFRASLRPRFTALQIAHQVHGSVVARHEGVAEGFHIRDATDGHVTAQRGLMLAVTIADCTPVYLARDDGSAVALLHCGWRGTASGMLEAGVQALCAAHGPLGDLATSRLALFLGVSICGTCYEVGPEVPLAVDGVKVAGKSCFDVRASLARRAEAAGIRDISVSSLCTSCDRDRFFSHRASADGGRQIAYLGIP
jgi:purine-nucleoside/S-methyl-5'-thioadenosine phosphorylase / adenosine deaminase